MSTRRFLQACGLQPGSVFPYSDNRFKKICQVGEGYGGRVVKAVDKQDPENSVALKIIDLKIANYTRAVQEVRNHNKLQHENIIRLRQVFVRSDRFVYLVLDYAELGDFQQFLLQKRGGVLPENMAKYFFRQIIKGVAHMHCQGIVSRDIKLTNILVQTNKDTDGQLPTIKHCDFGFSCDCNVDESKYEAHIHRRCEIVCEMVRSCVGTPDYIPPEIVDADGEVPYDGFKVDAWSCGVVLYNLVTGCQPFSGIKVGEKFSKGVTIESTINNVRSAEYSFPTDARLSEACLSLINGCLLKDPEARLSVTDMLQHPWLNQSATTATTATATISAAEPPSIDERISTYCP